jgi:hypothetical protein
MSPYIFGIILGGIIPAIGFGLVGIFTKLSTSYGLAVPLFLIILSISAFITTIFASITLFGFSFSDLMPISISSHSVILAVIAGSVWSLSMLCFSYGMSKLSIPISILAPITNLNLLVSIILGILFFRENNGIITSKFIIGSALMVCGAALIARP